MVREMRFQSAFSEIGITGWMRAPSDGYVVNWQVQPGTMLVPAPIAAAGTFVDTSEIAVAAVYPQNWLMNVQKGDAVEMVLDPYPGRIYTGKVDTVIPASGGGQFTTSGTIPNAARVGSDGIWVVKILFDNDSVARNVPLGAGGTAAIYTRHGKAVHIISKVAIRMVLVSATPRSSIKDRSFSICATTANSMPKIGLRATLRSRPQRCDSDRSRPSWSKKRRPFGERKWTSAVVVPTVAQIERTEKFHR